MTTQITAKNYEQQLKSLSFEVISTGGGFTAWRKALPRQHSILVTNADNGHEFKSDKDVAVIGTYDQDLQPLADPWEGPLDDSEESIALAIRFGNARAATYGEPLLDKPKILQDAVDAAVKVIQDALGVTDGGTAGMFFSGRMSDEVIEPLRLYMELELKMLKHQFRDPEVAASDASSRPTGG